MKSVSCLRAPAGCVSALSGAVVLHARSLVAILGRERNVSWLISLKLDDMYLRSWLQGDRIQVEAGEQTQKETGSTATALSAHHNHTHRTVFIVYLADGPPQAHTVQTGHAPCTAAAIDAQVPAYAQTGGRACWPHTHRQASITHLQPAPHACAATPFRDQRCPWCAAAASRAGARPR